MTRSFASCARDSFAHTSLEDRCSPNGVDQIRISIRLGGTIFEKVQRAAQHCSLLLLFFGLEFDHDTAQRSVTNVLRTVDHRWVERDSIGNDIDEDLRLAVGPLLKPGLVELHYDALAVAMSRSSIADREPLFKNKKRVAIISNRVLLGPDHFRRRLNGRMIRFDVDFEIRTTGRLSVRLATLEDPYVSARHLVSLITNLQFNLAKRDYHAIATAYRVRSSARRRVARYSNVVVVERWLRLKQAEDQQQSHEHLESSVLSAHQLIELPL
jgi:hypothetical protein